MVNWTRDLYNSGMKEKTIPLLIGEIRRYTGFNGEFPIKYEPWYKDLRGPRVIVNNIHKPEELRSKIIMPEPTSSTGYTEDVFLYLWDLAGELLHYIDIHNIPVHKFYELLPQKRSLENDSRIHLRALDITTEFMRRNYHEWYVKNYKFLNELKVTLHHTHLD